MTCEIFQGLPRYRFFSADTYGVAFQLSGIFLAVLGTSFFGGTAAVPGTTAKYGGTDFGGSRYCKILLSSIERKKLARQNRKIDFLY